MPIIRITREHIEEASAARHSALESDPEYRVFEERLESMRQAASRRKEHGEGQVEGTSVVPELEGDS